MLPQTRVSGKGKDFRGFYAPELRLISLAQNADPTTLAHELAHDTNATFKEYQQWVPEKYKSMMNLAYKDDNGKIVMPYLDQGAVEFLNNQPTYCYVG